MKVEIKSFLKKYTNKKITLVLNPGNLGDALISLGTFELFDQLKLNYEIHKPSRLEKTFKDKILFYSGGGNLIKDYPAARKFLIKNLDKNEIVILPHTINYHGDLIAKFKKNTTIFTREKESFKFVKKHFKHAENLFLSQDMAFYIKTNSEIDCTIEKENLNAFREDSERTEINLPKDNLDISWKLLEKPPFLGKSKKHSRFASNKIFKHIAKYKTIKTNRLHVAIAGALINKNVKLYPNSYYKNKAVYDYSIKEKFNKVEFIDQKDGNIKE